ncbi:MAG: 4Fe-4S dicluster domain-containing protein [bacterium]
MDALFLEFSKFGDFVRGLAREARVYSTRRADDDFHWYRFQPDSPEAPTLNSRRTAEPLKSLLFSARKIVAIYPSESPTIPKETEKKVVIGAKACDLRSLKIMDYVFKEGDFKDPFYIADRESTTIIASDCTEYKESCFCLALGINPYPEEDYDLSFAEVSGGLVFSSGSPKGEALIESHRSLFREASEDQIEERESKRKEFLKGYSEKISRENLPPRDSLQVNVKRNFESPIWNNRSQKCVECGACNLVCPTCHCFILEDHRRREGGFARTRAWDSCQYAGFARVAGGLNPRARLAERIRNRFVKKFDFFPENAGLYACTGCGRCSEACIAKIDIREVLKELAAA